MLQTKRHSKMQSNLDSRRFSINLICLLSIITIIGVPLRLTAQSVPKRPSEANWTCTKGKDFLRDRYGKAVWLNPKELESRARKKTPPQVPGTLGKNNLHGSVTLQVLIGKDGTVECARAIQGHPVAISSVITAIRDWIFEPFTVDQKPHAILGEIAVEYDFRR
jgi:hypothetical protein